MIGQHGAAFAGAGSLPLRLLGYAIVLGAEINAEMEHQTRRDTTTGPEEPMGKRGAFVADTLGRSAPEQKGKIS